MRRTATSNRSVVTAAKLVYSTWKINQPGERNGKAIYRNRLASQTVHLLHSIGKRADLLERVGLRGSGAVCEEAASLGRSGGGEHLPHEIVSPRSGAAPGARGGGRPPSVSGHYANREGKPSPP